MINKLDAARFIKARYPDIAVLPGLICLSIGWTAYLSSLVPPNICREFDVFYGADTPRVVADMLDVGAAHYRSKVHPVFPLLLLPPTNALVFMGLGRQAAIIFLLSLSGAITCCLLYLFSRRVGCPILASTLCALCFLSSAAYIFWWSVPETYAFGATTIALAMLYMTLKKGSIYMDALVNALTLSITTTNGSMGIIATVSGRKWKRAAAACAGGFSLVAILSIVQAVLMPGSEIFFMPAVFRTESVFMHWPTSFSALKTYGVSTIEFLLNTALASEPAIEGKYVYSSFMRFDLSGWLALACWFVLIAFALRTPEMTPENRRIRWGLLLFLAFQLALHCVYGEGPFLYSAHFLPAFVALIALGLATTRSRVILMIAGLYCITAAYSNLAHFERALALFRHV